MFHYLEYLTHLSLHVHHEFKEYMFHNNNNMFFFVLIIFISLFINSPLCITSFLTSISFIASIFNNNSLFLCFLSLFIISSHLIINITNISYYHIHFITFYLIYLFYLHQSLVLLFLFFHNFFKSQNMRKQQKLLFEKKIISANF